MWGRESDQRWNVQLIKDGGSWVEWVNVAVVVESDTVDGRRRCNWLPDDLGWPRTKHIDIDSGADLVMGARRDN